MGLKGLPATLIYVPRKAVQIGSSPLAGVWTDLGAQVIDWTRGLSGVLPQSGTGPALAPEFGPKSLVRSNWVTNDQPVFTITLAPADRNYEGYHPEPIEHELTPAGSALGRVRLDLAGTSTLGFRRPRFGET